MIKKPAVFLDRDGTLIEEIGYICNPDDIKLIEGTAEAVKKINDNGYLAIVVTNQSGVARGYFDEECVHRLNNALAKLLKEQNAYFDGVYYCAHHPKGTVKKYSIECNCRKPKPGLINQALKDFEEIDISKSYVIGDKLIDVELAHNSGCKGILVKTGYGADMSKDSSKTTPDFIANNVNDAVEWILNQ